MIALALVVLYIQVSGMHFAPLQLQFYNPYQKLFMPSHNMQQLLELQAMQQLNPLASMGLTQQPMLIILPGDESNIAEANEKSDNHVQILKSSDPMHAKGGADSIVIDAEPQPVLEDRKTILILPNGRFSLGDFISAIPFLPIEINVPDTISWAYNGVASGISGIISIIGQRLPGPFKRPPTDATMPTNLRTVISNIQMNEQQSVLRPIVMMPLGTRPIVPMQIQ